MRAAGGQVLVISQAKPGALALFARTQAWPFPVVADPDKAAYRAFGLARAGCLTFLRPDVLWGYLRIIFGGRLPGKPQEEQADVLQLGGDFVLTATGRVAYAYPSAVPTDRPAPAALLKAVRAAARAMNGQA